MTITLIGIGMVIVVVGLAAAVLLCGRPTTPQQRAEQSTPPSQAELPTPAGRPDWSAADFRDFAQTVPSLRIAAIAEAADEAAAHVFARLPEPEVPPTQGDPQS